MKLRKILEFLRFRSSTGRAFGSNPKDEGSNPSDCAKLEKTKIMQRKSFLGLLSAGFVAVLAGIGFKKKITKAYVVFVVNNNVVSSERLLFDQDFEPIFSGDISLVRKNAQLDSNMVVLEDGREWPFAGSTMLIDEDKREATKERIAKIFSRADGDDLFTADWTT